MMPQRSVEEYHVGVVCALPKEMMAARAMLDEEHELLDIQDAQDTNCYVLGSVHRHNVVIACLPAGTIGIGAAAVVGSNMLRTFTAIRFALLVGIGGGIPDIANEIDIRLGDVVISQPEGTHGGVVQYDLGKDTGGARFERIGSLSRPATSLLTALSSLQSDFRAPRRVTQHTSDIIQNIGPDEKCEFPGVDRDKLVCTRCDQAQWLEGCSECDHGIISRPLNRTNPKLHYGTIASGNRVVKNAAERDRLRDECNAKCVEMEAAGLMNEFRCLVIRGIADYADSHKNKAWQKYAAVTAAAFAKELLSKISPSTTQNMERIADVRDSKTHELLAESIRLQKEATLRKQKEDEARCLRAFKTSSYEEYKNANPNRVSDTCTWVLENKIFQRWRDSTKNDLLWISANPGCGKSVLSKCLVDEGLVVTRPSTICYFFFKDNDRQNQLTLALCAVLHQLFTVQPRLLKHAKAFWDRNGDRIQQEANELWKILLSATADIDARSVVCVLDALDECRELDRRELITRLCEFYQASTCNQSGATLKFVVTSRPYDSVQRWFIPITSHIPHVHLQGGKEHDQIGKEIDLVIDEKVNNIATEFGLSHPFQSRLRERLKRMQHRTYLWLHLTLEGIREKCGYNLYGDEPQLDLLPSSVEEVYEQLLGKINASHEPMARRILLIVVGAKRPLSIEEMAQALGAARASELDMTDLSSIDSNELESKIGHLCGLFVFISQSQIFLIHQTAKEFLVSHDVGIVNSKLWKFSLSFSSVELEMARICMTFLRWSIPYQNSPFYSYCALHWMSHLTDEMMERDSELMSKVLWLCDDESRQFRAWRKEFWPSFSRLWGPSISELFDISLIKPGNPYIWLNRRSNGDRLLSQHVFAMKGYTSAMLKIYSRHTLDLEVQDDLDRTALCWAALQGCHQTVCVLLEKGANVSADALHAASESGRLDIVLLLLDKVAHVGVGNDERYSSALHVASREGYLEIVRLLINRGADVNAEGDGRYNSALYTALRGGDLEIVRLSLEKWLDVNAEGDGRYNSPLYTARRGGDLEMVRLLHKKRTFVDIQERLFEDLYTALKEGDLEGGQRLIDDILADHDAHGERSGSALYTASEQGHIEIVRLLLDKGADINTRDGRSALRAASQQGYIEIVRLLLDKGAGVDTRDVTSALLAASKEGHIEIVRLLLNEGADVNTRDGKSALGAASEEGHIGIVRLLLDKGADIDVDMLWRPSSRGDLKMVQLLLDEGADIKTRDGSSALQAASKKGHIEIVRLLLDKGADIDVNMLWRPSRRGDLEMVQLLLDYGACDGTSARSYREALFEASEAGHEQVVRALLSQRQHTDLQADRMYCGILNTLWEFFDSKVVANLVETNDERTTQHYQKFLQTLSVHEKKVPSVLAPRELFPEGRDECLRRCNLLQDFELLTKNVGRFRDANRRLRYIQLPRE